MMCVVHWVYNTRKSGILEKSIRGELKIEERFFLFTLDFFLSKVILFQK